MSDLVHRLKHSQLAFAHHGPGLHPCGVDVGEVEGVDKLPFGTISRMGYKVYLGKAWYCDIPVLCLERDVMFEQGSWLGPAIEFPFELLFSAFEPSVDGSGLIRRI